MVEEAKRVPLAHPDLRLESVNIHSLMEKIASKRDVYNLLAMECEAYLPKMDTVNISFLKQIARAQMYVRLILANHTVHQATAGEGRTADRWTDHRRLPEVCTQQSSAAQASAG